MKMVRYKRLLVAACVFAALSVSTVSAADTATLNENDLVIDKTTTEAGEQVLPPKKNLEEVEQARTGSIEVVLTDGKAGTDKSNVKIRCQKVSEIVHGEYVLLKSYKDAGVDLNAIENSNDLKNAAEQLLSKAEESTNTNVTDANGTVTFKNLEVGVYLISAEDTERYDTVEPSLIAVPFQFQEIGSGAKGYYSNAEKLVAIQTGMSQAQTMKTAVHETAHAIFHDRDVMEENGITKDRMTKEVEAESVAYVVCNHFGLDTSDYSFNYVAGWSSDKEMPELRSSMDTIRLTSSQLIADITEKLLELQKTRKLENDIKTEELTEESSFLSHTENSYAIYQYHQADNEMGYQYMSLDFIEKMGMSVKGSDYQMMYQGVLEAQDTLEDLYIKFNIDRPEDFEGHSMSTSDVVILKRDGEMKAYYVNDIGFRELPEFVDQRAEVLQEKNSECVRKQDKSGKEQEEPEKIREDRTITETIQSNEHSNVSKKKNQQMQAGLHR